MSSLARRHVCIRPNIAAARRVGYAGVPNGTRHRCQECGLLATATPDGWIVLERMPRDALPPDATVGAWTTPWDRALG